MDSPTDSDQGSPDNTASTVPRVTMFSNLPHIRNWERQYLDNNSVLLSQLNWENSIGDILNNDADEQSSETKARQQMQNRKFFQSMIQELNATEWMFRTGGSS
jgi:hypothetical protein